MSTDTSLPPDHGPPGTRSVPRSLVTLAVAAALVVGVAVTVAARHRVDTGVSAASPTSTVGAASSTSSTTEPPTATTPSLTSSAAPSTTASPATSRPAASTPPSTVTSPVGAQTWPGPGNTGVPSGRTLVHYSGPCRLDRPVTLTGVDALDCGALIVASTGVVIEDSKIPRVDSTDKNGSVTITDSTVVGGDWVDGTLWGYHIVGTRLDITGGQHNVHCADDCTITDSWLHDQYNPASESYHNNAFISNGGSHMLLRHNTLHCTAVLNANDGGCTADVSLFGDFEPISDVVVDDNYFGANGNSISFCAYGGAEPQKAFPTPSDVRYTNNVFERGANGKCGVYGPVTSMSTAGGNVWSGNRFTDGALITP